MTAPTDLDGVEWNFIAAQGFSYDFLVTLLNSDGSPYNLTGETVELAVRTGYKDPVVLLLTTTSTNSLLTITTPANGQISVHFDSLDTETLSAPKNYVYDLRVNNYRKVWGVMSLRAGVTVNV